MDEDLPRTPETVVCGLAQVRHRNAARWLQLYNLLIFTLAAIVVVFLAVTLLFFARNEGFAGLVSAAGTVVTGTATAWVLKRRGDAKSEELEAFNLVSEHCGTAVVAEETRRQATFLRVR